MQDIIVAGCGLQDARVCPTSMSERSNTYGTTTKIANTAPPWGMDSSKVGHSTRRCRDKLEPIFGDLAIRTVPCNCFLNLFFFVAAYSTLPGRCAPGFWGHATYGRFSWTRDHAKYGRAKSSKIEQRLVVVRGLCNNIWSCFEGHATPDSVSKPLQNLK